MSFSIWTLYDIKWKLPSWHRMLKHLGLYTKSKLITIPVKHHYINITGRFFSFKYICIYMMNVCYTIHFWGLNQSYFSNRLSFKWYNATNFLFSFLFRWIDFCVFICFPFFSCKQCWSSTSNIIHIHLQFLSCW